MVKALCFPCCAHQVQLEFCRGAQGEAMTYDMKSRYFVSLNTYAPGENVTCSALSLFDFFLLGVLFIAGFGLERSMGLFLTEKKIALGPVRPMMNVFQAAFLHDF